MSDDEMQSIAREFNFSETTFVFPSEGFLTGSHFPRRVFVGLPFLTVELRDRTALSRCQVRADSRRDFTARAGCDAVHVYTRDTGEDDVDIRCRMFAT